MLLHGTFLTAIKASERGSLTVAQYETELADQCLIAGDGVLQNYGYHTGETGKWVGIMIGIIAGYRVLGWVVLHLRRN